MFSRNSVGLGEVETHVFWLSPCAVSPQPRPIFRIETAKVRGRKSTVDPAAWLRKTAATAKAAKRLREKTIAREQENLFPSMELLRHRLWERCDVAAAHFPFGLLLVQMASAAPALAGSSSGFSRKPLWRSRITNALAEKVSSHPRRLLPST